MIALVAAMDRNRVIGQDGKMPWHMPADLKHFRRLTKGHVVVMGRKTYESIGGPLRGRTNVILTRDKQYEAPGCVVAHSAAEILQDERSVFIIGGGEVYRQFLPHADRLYVTRIEAEFEGDTFFPAFDARTWRLTASVPHRQDEKNPYDCRFETYERV